MAFNTKSWSNDFDDLGYPFFQALKHVETQPRLPMPSVWKCRAVDTREEAPGRQRATGKSSAEAIGWQKILKLFEDTLW
jgi:hypothetical protein